MRRVFFLILPAFVACAAFFAPARAERKLVPDGVLTDTTGRTFVRVTLNDRVPAVLLYQEDLPYVILTRKAFRRLGVPLERQPALAVRIGTRRVKVKKFRLRRISVGESACERIDAAVIVSGGLPAHSRDGAIGRQMLEQLGCAF